MEELSNQYRVLFVCMGNICRSPTAEGVFRKLVDDEDLSDRIFIDSAGTSSYHSGDAPDRRSMKTALNHGIDISEQRSRILKVDDFKDFDLIIAMDEGNFIDIQNKKPIGDDRYDRAKISKMMDYAPELDNDVPDPYYGNNGFELVFEMIITASQNLLQEIKKEI